MSAPDLERTLAWLVAQPTAALYAIAFGLAFIENVFPPFPSDVLIAACAFVAAQGDGSLAGTYVSVLVGHVSGAALMYFVGERFGAAGLHRRLEARGLIGREQRLEAMYARHGMVALFLGRLVPGVRGIVPAVAGALRLGVLRSLAVIALASAIWYGVLTTIAYRVGDNWDEFSDDLATFTAWGAGTGIALVVIATGVAFWFYRARRRER